MKKLLLLPCVIASVQLFSQNYQLMKLDRQSYFSGYNINQGANYFLAPDSVSWDDSLASYYRTALPIFCIEEEKQWAYDLYFWLSNPVQWDSTTGIYHFANDTLESIEFRTQTQIGERWTVYTYPNGNVMEAVHMESSLSDVLGVQDLIKEFSIIHKDSTGMVISHDRWDGKTFRIGEQSGWVQTYNFDRFPSDTFTLYLSSLSNPNLGPERLNAGKIYDFDPGDVLHVEETGETDSGYPLDSTYEKFEILSRLENASQDTIVYQVWRQKIFNSFQDNEWIVTNDTIPWVIPVHSLSHQPGRIHANGDSLLRKWVNEEYVCSWERSDAGDGRRYKYYNPRWSKGLGGLDCFKSSAFENLREDYGIEGLGGGYYRAHTIASSLSRWLVYYKKGIEEWGTPLDFDNIISSIDPQENSLKAEVWPNPSTARFHIQFAETLQARLSVYTIQGQLIQVKDIVGREADIDLSDQADGLYLLSVQSDQGRGSRRLIKQ
ncbi:MAG: T9SS type A sorting domain-containing protein [Bacteroidota bacterium]